MKRDTIHSISFGAPKKIPRPDVSLVCTTPSGTPIKPKNARKRLSLATQSRKLLDLENERAEYLRKAAELKALIEESTPEAFRDMGINGTNNNTKCEILRDMAFSDRLTLAEEEEDKEIAPVLSVYYDHNDVNYTTLEQVGKGSFGVCHLVEHNSTGERLCRKTIDLCQKDMDMTDARGECTFLNRIVHPNCLKLFDLHINPLMELSIYMEYCPWSLESLRLVRGAKGVARDRLDTKTVLQAAYQTLKGLDYLKHFGRDSPEEEDKTVHLVHTDIKSDNLLVSFDGKVKIGDFGLAVLLPGGQEICDKVKRGTAAYMAPEVKQSKPYSEPADMFSLGASIYELITGKLPTAQGKPLFWDKTLKMLNKTCINEEEAYYVHELLQLMMKTDPIERPTPSALLKGEFFHKYTQSHSEAVILTALARGEHLHQSYLKFKKECQQAGAETLLSFASSSSNEDSSKDSSEEA